MQVILQIGAVILLSAVAVARVHESRRKSDSECKALSDYLVSLGYPSDHVPPRKLRGENALLEICLKSRPSQSLCCTNSTEHRLQKAAVDIFYRTLMSTVDHLHTLLWDRSAYYQDEYQLSVDKAANNTRHVLRDIYRLSDVTIHSCVEDLFHDVSKYLHGDDNIDLRDSVFRFYNSIFPVVFQNLLSDPSAVSVSSAYRDCLMSVYHSLNPNPFGNIPLNLGASLAHSAQTVRLLMAGLDTAADVFHEMAQWSITQHCSESLAQLVTCAACHGSKDIAKPCHGYCTNVMEGCLAGANDIDLLWRQFVDKLVDFQRKIQKDDLESILYLMHLNISESVLHSLETTHKYYQQIVSRCGRPSSSSLPANKVSEFSSHGRLHDLSDLQFLPGLQVQIGMVMRTVVTSLGIFQRLPNVICSHENFMADSELTCWNGTEFAEYRPSASSRATSFAQTWPQTATVSIIRHKLSDAHELGERTEINERKARNVAEDDDDDDATMYGDQPYDDDNGSGYRNSRRVDDPDDEDMSGSGRYSNSDRNQGHKELRTTDFDFADVDQRKRTTRIFSPYVTTRRPLKSFAPRSLSNTAQSVYLLLLTVTAFVVFFQ